MDGPAKRRSALDEAGIEAQVRAFYGRARQDPQLGPVFENAIEDWEAHFALLTRFWCSAMLGAGSYRGSPVLAHQPHALSPEHFTRWLALWGETADALFTEEPAAALKGRAERIGESLRLVLFGPRRRQILS